ncbi:hypothetical protein B296_00044860 [Ensete ventricosum]|uniref:Uncharacterized protein n=1 Tax=Ensete ventricosum TaxID=4639 RepID=A0A426YHH2_ENSVE|nr:hypothetical protein B296_00044860 [Ensete ventricosum]
MPAGAAPTGNHLLRAGLGRDLATGGRPCMGVGCGWLPLLLAIFTMKMQEERVERFYAIKSHHTAPEPVATLSHCRIPLMLLLSFAPAAVAAVVLFLCQPRCCLLPLYRQSFE